MNACTSGQTNSEYEESFVYDIVTNMQQATRSVIIPCGHSGIDGVYERLIRAIRCRAKEAIVAQRAMTNIRRLRGITV